MGPIVLRFCAFLLISTVTLQGNLDLKRSDVRETIDEMLNVHVEHREMSPLLISRAIKVFIEQFDGLKMYLLESEASQFFNLSDKQLREGAQRYRRDDLSTFEQVNALIETSIKRSQGWRYEIEKELTLSALDVEPLRGEVHLSYATDEAQLKARTRKQLIRILMEEKRVNKLAEWTPGDRQKIFSFWEERLKKKEDSYTDGQEHHLCLHTLRALSKSLDAHTAFFSPEEALELRAALEKQFDGVGVVLRQGIHGVVIEDLIAGGPAERSGKVEVGDRIVEIDHQKLEGMSYDQVLRAMKGNGSKELHLGLVRKADGKIQEVFLVREKIMMNDERLRYTSVPCGDGQIGILTLPSFYEGAQSSSAEKDIRDAIKKLKKQAPLKGIVLDLRENSGGFLTQAAKITGLFITKGVVVISKYSKGEVRYFRNLDGRQYFDGPLIVLTSRASASAAEIVAQALQDYGVALIVGDEETYGKGTIQYQTVTDKEAKSFYKVTVGRYYTVSGRSTQIEGVKADIVVPTIFSSYKIGERFLEYPLPSDQVAAAFIDPLSDIDLRSRAWFQKNYLPNLYQPHEKWKKMIPALQKNSTYRQQTDKSFSLFLQTQNKIKGRPIHSFRRISNPPWGNEDLQMKESLNIMADILSMDNNS